MPDYTSKFSGLELPKVQTIRKYYSGLHVTSFVPVQNNLPALR